MSHYETPEQRHIRELQGNIRSLRGEVDSQKSRNSDLQRELERARRQQREENERLTQRMQEQQNAARRQQAQMSDRIRQLDGEVKRREELQAQKIREMQSRHDAQMQQLHTQFRDESRSLRGEISQTRAEMEQGFADMREETDQKLRQQREENQRALRQMDDRLQGKIREVDGRVTSLAQQIAEKEQGDRELAVYWAQEAARMLRQIREAFRPSVRDEAQLSRLDRKIRQANDDIQGGQYQSSITAGRDAFFDALDMKEELVQASLEWNYWFNAVKEREAQLLEALDSARNRTYEIDADGETIVYSNGVDYWTYGQLSIVEEQISALRSSLQDIDSMTIDQLRSRVEAIRALQEQLALVENTARTNVAMSLSRYETAGKIGSILGDSYLMTDADGDYFAQEDREEYHAVFENPVTGDQAAVVITPVPDEAGVVTNHIDLIIGNADNNPVTRDDMTTDVAEQLRSSGVDGCSFPCASRFHDQTGQEVSRVGNIPAVEEGDEKTRASVPQGAGAHDPAAVEQNIRRRVRSH